MNRLNLAARAGRWSAEHWKTATAIWIVVVLVAIAAGRMAGTHKLSDAEQATGETARAEHILASAGFSTPASESVLVKSTSSTADDRAFQSTVRSVMAKLRTMPQVQNLRTGAVGEISKDRHAQLVEFDMKGKHDTADKRVQPLLDAVSGLQRAHPDFTIAEFGMASATHELNDTIQKDFKHAESLSVPITFLILLIAFGAFVAAGVPVLLAFSAVLGSIGLSQVVSHLAHASDATQSVMLLMGMAVGVDYSLFYLKREREERAAGHKGHDGLYRAAATSGQAVLISGVTVLIAMAGMLFAGSKIFTSIGIGAMIVVFTSLVGSLTVLPALLGKLGDRYIERGIRQVLAAGVLRLLRLFKTEPRWLVKQREKPTLLRRLKGDRQESRVWGFVITRSMRRPAIAVALSTAVLVVLALPVLNIHTKLLSFTDLPKSLSIVKTYDTIQASFPGTQDPAHVVVKADNVTTPPFAKAYAEFKKRALATGVIHQPIRVSVNKAKTVARVDFPLAGKGQDATAIRALETLRTIVIPIKAIILNLLSVGAAYGVLVWIFQDGHLQGLLNFHSNGAVVTWLPLFLFTVLFGLSMDYHVFILSRVKELVDHGMPTDQAVERGIRTTASTVTRAAAVMIAVFAIFASLRTLDIKQLGVGLAVAVFIDATLIRGVLLPAAMKLLGDWNWYLPRWLEWLPSLSAEGGPAEKAPEAPAVPAAH